MNIKVLRVLDFIGSTFLVMAGVSALRRVTKSLGGSDSVEPFSKAFFVWG
jgi:hypothetical protein